MSSTCSTAANAPAFDLLARVPPADRSAWERRLRAPVPAFWPRLVRLAAAKCLRGRGRLGRWVLTGAKRVRARLKPNPLRATQALPRPPWRTNADLVLTHDLDWKECWEALDTILAWEQQMGLRCTIEVLTNGPYRLDRVKLNEWASRGVEIGLHGEWHDPALAYHRPEQIEETLRRAIDALGRPPVFFRSPALSVSPALFDILARIGIPADGSLPVFSSIYPGCGFPSPYRYPGASLLEMPLALQDDMLFRERSLPDDEALDRALDLLQRFREVGGTMVINTHPGVIVGHERFYRGLLDACRERALRCLPVGEVGELGPD